jgi:protein SCO1
VGGQFQVIYVSIDPGEGPELAAAKKRAYLRRYGRARTEAGWHFLTGEERSIRQLAAEVGFQYAYDPALRQYAHPSGFTVLTGEGKVARYFFGVAFPPKELSLALREAAAEKTGSVVEQLYLLCFHYSPLRGRYGQAILTILRLAGLATVLGMVAIVVRGRQRHEPKPAGASASARPAPPMAAGVSAEPAREDRA